MFSHKMHTKYMCHGYLVTEEAFYSHEKYIMPRKL
jgi:hypothetical protein